MATGRFGLGAWLYGTLVSSGSRDAYIQHVLQDDGTGTAIVGPSADQIGALTETAPTTDTASSGLNGRLQRIAQRLTSAIALLAGFPTAASRILSAANTTNSTSAKASAGKLFGAYGYNANAALRYLKVYDKATAPTVGTDVPVLTVALPPTAAFALDFGGVSFATGIGYGLTTGVADNDTGAVTAADILALNIVYS